jgi:molybdate transport system ATP-binding protein
MIELRIRRRLFTAHGELTLEVDERVARGEMLALFGESGAGKTTLLRILAGLDRPDEGRIVVDGVVWFDSATRTALPVHRRSLGFVFQEPALFPNMTVRENLAYALPGRKTEGDAWLAHLLRETELTRLADRLPTQLSGGQAQRVAFARAVARRPSVLLLDEPLSALDAPMRARLRKVVLSLHRELGLTSVLVSHDVGEVMRLADRMLVMEVGRLTSRGTPVEVFAGEPAATGTDESTIPAEVLRVEETSDGSCLLHVLVNDRVVKVPAPEGRAAVGDSILLSTGSVRVHGTPGK